jgi:hypothetical protein
MTVNQLAELTATLMKYDVPDSEAHRLDIMFTADGVRGALIEVWVSEHGKSSLAQFATDLYLPVQTDQKRGLPFVEIGGQILGLDDNAGIIDIGMPQEYDESFTLIKDGMASVYSHLEAGQNLGKIVGFLRGTAIYFKYLNAGQQTIRVTCIPTLFGIVDPNSQIPMPLEFTDRLTTALRLKFQEIKHTATDKLPGARDILEGTKPEPQQQ